MSIVITVHYGIDEVPKNFDRDSISVGEVISNSTVKAALGYGDNVKGLISGVEVPNSAMLTDGDHLYLEVKANSKAIEGSKVVINRQALFAIRSDMRTSLAVIEEALAQ